MHQHVGGGESEVAARDHDAHEPGGRGGGHDEMLARVVVTARDVPGRPQRIGDERDDPDDLECGKGGAKRGQREEVTVDEPGEREGSLGMPVDEGEKRRGIDRGLIDYAIDCRSFASARSIDRRPPHLLTHEMERSCVGQHAPEPEGRRQVERCARDEYRARDAEVEERSPRQLRTIEVGAKECRPHVGDVDEHNQQHEAPGRERPIDREQRSERDQREPGERRAAEDADVDGAAPEPGPGERHPAHGNGQPLMAAEMMSDSPMMTAPITIPSEVF